MPQDPASPAREFYRAHLRESFIHTGLFAASVQRIAEEVVDKPEFDAITGEAPQGALDAARRIGELAIVHLDGAPNPPGPWWRDLCNYDRGVFMQRATTDPGPPTNRPRRGVSALCATFNWNMPEIVARLRSGEAINEDLRRPITLLFARTAEGKVHIVEVGSAVEKVFRATNGLRTVEQVASTADVPLTDTQQILNALGGIGAVVLGKSAEEIMRVLREQGKA
ncbi:MAG TPA: hypothetical protein VD837_15560 [Terriglobales bacterium]|nr:hypothetical protein [Terriglobales bacterium]